MSVPRKHHFLPQFYLELFSENGLVTRLEKHSGQQVVASPTNLGAIRDFHRLDDKSFGDQFQLEKKLGEIESELSRNVVSVVEGGISDQESHVRLLEFLSLMRMRVPAIKDWMKASLQTLVRSTGNLQERQGELPAPPPGLEHVLKIDNLDIEISNWFCLQLMFSLAASPEILEILLRMTPTIVRSGDGSEFITCDQPVALFSSRARRDDPYGVGLTDSAAELSLPLSSNVLLLLSWDEGAPRTRLATDEEVREFNRRSVIMSDRYLFARAFDDEALAQANRNAHRFAGFEPSEVVDVNSAMFLMHRFKPVLPEEQYE